MAILSPRKDLIRLREFVNSGADTTIILYHIDHLLTLYRSHTYSDGCLAQNKQLLDQLKKTKKKVKQLEETLCFAKEAQRNTKIDMDMSSIKIKNLEKEVQQLRHKQNRWKRPLTKQSKKQFNEVGVQWTGLSLEYVHDLISIARKSRNECDQLRQQVLQIQKEKLDKSNTSTEETVSNSTLSQSSGEDTPLRHQTSLEQIPQSLLPYTSRFQSQEDDDDLPQAVAVNQSHNIINWFQAKANQFISVFKSQ